MSFIGSNFITLSFSFDCSFFSKVEGLILLILLDLLVSTWFSVTEPKISPTLTVEPSLELISISWPVTGDGTSKLTLSVSNSTIGSSISTESPWFFNHFETVASVILSPKAGTNIY